MTIATSARDYLAREGVQYEVISHERTGDSTHSAQAAHVPGDLIVKCVMLQDRHGYLMAVLPATHKVNLRAVRRQLNRKLSLAPDGEVAGLFKDCEPGAIPPLGAAYGLDAVLDESLIGSPDIYFEAGDHETLVHVTGDDFLRLMIGVRRGGISQHL